MLPTQVSFFLGSAVSEEKITMWWMPSDGKGSHGILARWVKKHKTTQKPKKMAPPKNSVKAWYKIKQKINTILVFKTDFYKLVQNINNSTISWLKPEALKSLYRSPGYKKNQLVLCKNFVLQW